MIHILVVDHYEAVGKGTKLLLEKEVDFKVTVLTSWEEALGVILQQHFDMFLFDFDISAIRGQDFIKRVTEIDPKVKMIIYTGYDVEPFFHTFIELGISGFVSKTASKEQLIGTIRSVLRGDAVIPMEFFEQLRRVQNHSSIEKLNTYELTNRERTVLEQVALGKTNKEIAEVIFLSQRSVEYCLTNIFEKLAVGSRMEAVEKVRSMGLIGEFNRWS